MAFVQVSQWSSVSFISFNLIPGKMLAFYGGRKLSKFFIGDSFPGFKCFPNFSLPAPKRKLGEVDLLELEKFVFFKVVVWSANKNCLG